MAVALVQVLMELVVLLLVLAKLELVALEVKVPMVELVVKGKMVLTAYHKELHFLHQLILQQLELHLLTTQLIN